MIAVAFMVGLCVGVFGAPMLILALDTWHVYQMHKRTRLDHLRRLP